jgi:hypothetical protein
MVSLSLRQTPQVHHKIPSDKNLGFRVFIDWMEVEETAGCSGDYLQFGRDTFVVTDRISQKFCNKVTIGKEK